MKAQRVLLVWQYGRNFGHLARLHALARELQSQGCEPVWAVPGAHTDREAQCRSRFVAQSGLRCVQAPPPEPLLPQAHATRIHSFADILLAFGFANVDPMTRALREWLALFERAGIDRVLLDYAPHVQFAACVAALPAAQITNGFDAPPPQCPPFGAFYRGPHVERLNRHSVNLLDQAIACVAGRLGARPGLGLTALLASPTQWFDCIAETDPYGGDAVRRTRRAAYIGPQGRPPRVGASAWPAAPGADRRPRAFAYLRGADITGAVVRELARLGASVQCVWPDAGDAALRELNQRPGVSVRREPVDTEQALAQADVVVNYGSATLACQTLLAGKPQLMLPSDIEKLHVAKRVQAAGAGVALPVQNVAGVADATTRTLSCLERAREIGSRYHGTHWSEMRRRAVSAWLADQPHPLPSDSTAAVNVVLPAQRRSEAVFPSANSAASTTRSAA